MCIIGEKGNSASWQWKILLYRFRSVGGRAVVRLYKDITKKDYYAWILISEIDPTNGV